VWSNSCQSTIAIAGLSDNSTYLVYLLLFAFVVCPLTCMELHEQVMRRTRKGLIETDGGSVMMVLDSTWPSVRH